MKTTAVLRALAATALLTVACGTTTGSGTASQTLATPTVASSPTPKGVCDSAHPCLALVTLRGSNAIVVRDITDISHPTTVSSFQHDWPQFVNGTTLSYVADGTSLFRAPLSGDPKELVAKTTEQFSTDVWSPDGDTAAYLA